MISKEDFIEFISAYKKFDEAVDRFDQAITGKSYSTILFETDWYDAVGKMLDIFLDTHFKDAGKDVIYWQMFEEVDHIITANVDPDLFNGKSEVKYDVNNIEDLYDYLIKFKEDYIKNA